MLEQWLVWERDAFFLLNGSDSSSFDHFMWLYSGKVVWLPLALFLLVVLVYKRGWREAFWLVLMIALTITLCDQFASHVCKPIFTRFRPTHHPDFMDQVKVVFGYRGGKYGFISSHAANSFGFAMLLALIFRNRWLTGSLFLWATLNAYSRIYLGVHFITDIIPGALSGLFFGWIVYRLYRLGIVRWHLPEESVWLSTRKAHVMAVAIVGVIVFLFVLADPLVSVLK